MTKLTLTNSFHNTKATVNVEARNVLSRTLYFLTASQMHRVAKALCGMKDCRCDHVNFEVNRAYTNGSAEIRVKEMQ